MSRRKVSKWFVYLMIFCIATFQVDLCWNTASISYAEENDDSDSDESGSSSDGSSDSHHSDNSKDSSSSENHDSGSSDKENDTSSKDSADNNDNSTGSDETGSSNDNSSNENTSDNSSDNSTGSGETENSNDNTSDTKESENENVEDANEITIVNENSENTNYNSDSNTSQTVTEDEINITSLDDENEDSIDEDKELDKKVSQVIDNLGKNPHTTEAVDEIRNILGEYGVVAEEVKIGADFESNLRTDLYDQSGTQTIGSSEKYAGTSGNEIVIGSVAEGVDYIQVGHDVKTDVVISDKIDKESISINTAGKVTQEDIKQSAAEALAEVSKIADAMQSVTADITIDRNDQNNEKIDCSSTELDVVYADVTVVEEYDWTNQTTTGTGKVSQQSGGMKIVMDEGQMCIINVKPGNATKIIMTEFYVTVNHEDGTTTQFNSATQEKGTIQSAVDNIVFNFGDFEGEIVVGSGISGTIIAPNANVIVNSTSSGQVASKTFANSGGEWHYVGTSDSKKDTTDEPSTSEPSTGEPSTGEPSTGEPSTSEPTTNEPSTGEPSTGEPSTGEPSTNEPTTSEPSDEDKSEEGSEPSDEDKSEEGSEPSNEDKSEESSEPQSQTDPEDSDDDTPTTPSTSTGGNTPSSSSTSNTTAIPDEPTALAAGVDDLMMIRDEDVPLAAVLGADRPQTGDATQTGALSAGFLMSLMTLGGWIMNELLKRNKNHIEK